MPGHDGWLTYGGPVDGAMQILSPTEVDESMFPIIYECRELAIDTLGHGEWDGAPGTKSVYRPTHSEMKAVYCSDGDTFPSKGVSLGHDGAPSANWKRSTNGELTKLPSFHEETCYPGEAFSFVTTGGGGYGNPLKRPPDRVVATINRGWLSSGKAEEIYGVVVIPADNGIEYCVDVSATLRRRAELGVD